ncbi:MAG: hypothetical protein ACFCBU_03180 [Cyanophyceae cyanobacterium]
MRKSKLFWQNFKQRWLLTAFAALVLLVGSSILVDQPTAAAKEAHLPKQYIGVWEGIGIQDNGVGWSILIALTPGPQDSVVGTIAYPSIPCNGKLLFKGKEDNHIQLSEDLTHAGICAAGGTISLFPDTNDKLNYKWFHPDGREDGEGSLDRISAMEN